MYLEGIRLLAAHGLEQYEISNYARPGFFSRHNMGYWTGADYLGLGPAATSTLEGRRWTDTPDQARWLLRDRGSTGCSAVGPMKNGRKSGRFSG